MPNLISAEAWELQSQQEQPLTGAPQGRSVQQLRQAAGPASEGADALQSEIEEISSDLAAQMPGPPSGSAGVHQADVDASELLQPLAGMLRQDGGSLAPASATLPLHGASVISPQGSWPKLKRCAPLKPDSGTRQNCSLEQACQRCKGQ